MFSLSWCTVEIRPRTRTRRGPLGSLGTKGTDVRGMKHLPGQKQVVFATERAAGAFGSFSGASGRVPARRVAGLLPRQRQGLGGNNAWTSLSPAVSFTKGKRESPRHRKGRSPRLFRKT